MSTFLAATAIVVSFLTVAYQVRSAGKQALASRRAEQIAGAFFDLYEGWAQNRRAQVEPMDGNLLRTSAAQYTASAFRLTALVDDKVVDEIKKFMEGGLGGQDTGDESFEALWRLHGVISRTLAYRKHGIGKQRFREMFWMQGRNVPNVFVGTIDGTSVNAELVRARSPREASSEISSGGAGR